MEDIKYKLATVTRSAAIAAHTMIGSNDKNTIDQLAVIAMKSALLDIDQFMFNIVCGEGEMDEAPLLLAGTSIGNGNCNIDIAVDPVECTKRASQCMSDAFSVLVAAFEGSLLRAPDVYMEKIAVGANLPKGIVSVKNSLKDNLFNISKARNKNITDMKVCLLERDRHMDMINEINAYGAKVHLISDGDIAGAMYPILEIDDIDMYYGIGGSPEGIISAAAIKNLGGQFSCKLIFSNEHEIKRAGDMGINNLDAIYDESDLCHGDVIFVATGITNGIIVDGVYKGDSGTISTETIMITEGRIDKLLTECDGKKYLQI